MIDWRNLDSETAERIRKDYLHVERSKMQLQKDLTTAFDRIHGLQRVTDRQAIMLWITSGALVAVTGAAIWLGNHLYECLDLAHKIALR